MWCFGERSFYCTIPESMDACFLVVFGGGGGGVLLGSGGGVSCGHKMDDKCLVTASQYSVITQ